MEEKTESFVKYDDRKKEMTQHIRGSNNITVEGETIGEVLLDRKAIFKEDGIRKIFKDLIIQQKKLEGAIKKAKEDIKEAKELTPELLELEKKIQIINNFNKCKPVRDQLKVHETDLKTVRKDVNDIKKAIGTRLKL